MTDMLRDAGHPAYRARQLFQWVYEKGAQSFDDMTNLPKPLRTWLHENTIFGGLTLHELLGPPTETQKLAFATDDGEIIESVLMRGEPDDEDDEEKPGAGTGFHAPGSTPPARKVSLCVSSQVGCPLGCAFCMTGKIGYRRNLRIDEILDQILTARLLIAKDERISNLVFMGMGEPMLNLSALIPALRILTNPDAFGFATRRITVSTAGLIPGIEEFGRAATDVNLAISLNATTQQVRDRLMPACHQWPIDQLLEACRRYPLTKRRRITFEYILFKGINDTPEDQRHLVRLLAGIPCKVNLILYNRLTPTATPSTQTNAEVLNLEPTDEQTAENFRAALAAAHLTASLRRSKGTHLHAACGQLAGHLKSEGS